jgi:hypothetical protein
VADCELLQEIVLSNTPVASIEALGQLRHLHTLDLRCTRVEDVAPLAGCSALAILGMVNEWPVLIMSMA